MRILEIVLVIATAVAAVSLLFTVTRTDPTRGRPAGSRIMPGAALSALVLVVAAQLVIEHARLQMATAYLAAAVVLAVLLVRLVRIDRSPAQRGRQRWRILRRSLAGIAIAALLGTSTVASVALPVWTMPSPTGAYAIGSVDIEMVDADRPETHTADPDDDRRVMTTVWYPADPGEVADRPRSSYPRGVGSAISSVFGLPGALFAQADLVSTHVVENAPAAESSDGFPVVLFSPGVSSTRFQSMMMVEELVSRGFVVVGIDHPYTSALVEFPDGSVADAADDITDTGDTDAEHYDYNVSEVGIRVADVSFVLDKLEDPDDIGLTALTGRLDLDTVGIVGHSFGGATAVQALAVDDRIDAGLSLEGGFWGSVTSTGVDKPLAFLASESTAEAFRTHDTSAGYTPELARDLETTLERSSSDVYAAVIDGFVHQSFTDLALVSPALFAEGMDPEHNVDITRTFAASFFETLLRGDDASSFGTDSPAYPEVHFADDPTRVMGG